MQDTVPDGIWIAMGPSHDSMLLTDAVCTQAVVPIEELLPTPAVAAHATVVVDSPLVNSHAVPQMRPSTM